MSRYAEVIVPLGLNATFTYIIPPGLTDSISVGSRVIVPFGKSKFYTAIVTAFPLKAPDNVEPKEISAVLDPSPIVRHPQLKLWNWIADYYLAAIGDVYRAAVPSGLKIESETSVMLDPSFDFTDSDNYTKLEIEVLQHIDHEKSMSVSSLEKNLGRNNLTPVINRLIERGAVSVSEKLVERYCARKETFVTLAMPVDAAFEKLKKSRAGTTLLQGYLQISELLRRPGNPSEVTRQQLAERTGIATAHIRELERKGVFALTERSVNRFNFSGISDGKLPVLSEKQADALDQIHKSWLSHDVTLLHGVTSSGKTEIYIHLIDFVLKSGRRAFYLVPEIALTTQLTERLQNVFGDRVLIYHSKFSDNERVDIWKKLLDTSAPCVVIGARSAVFLPFGNLGLVIVDEEHEPSYKQSDPAPRYNARDVAVVLASLHGAKTLLGSATPSIETNYKALSGKFGHVRLMTRYNDAKLPTIEITDLKQARDNREYRAPFALSTIRAANLALNGGNQVIFFQNRRGFAPIARCTACSWSPRCEFCDVAMTYHKSTRQLVCHYCGATHTLPTVCPQCHEPKIEIYGFGTERIEDIVSSTFEKRKVLRMDLDTTRNKEGHARIISDFSSKKADILVGTQMVTKGLDFDGVSVVGVLNADTMINIPDFRSAERSFNMLEQVSGRAGRRSDVDGKVIIQTHDPSHPVLKFVAKHDYDGFYAHELEERRTFSYPPFTRIINIYLKHRDLQTVKTVSDLYASNLRDLLGRRVNGPEEPIVSRIQSLYIRKLMLKIETGASMTKVKELLRDLNARLCESYPEVKRTLIYYDVDPV